MTSKPVSIAAASEPWSEFILEDGTKIRARLILTAAAAKPDGNYDLSWQIVMAPPEQKRPDAATALDARPN